MAQTSHPEEPTFEQALQSVETSLANLKARYAQVQADEQQRHDLQQRQSNLMAHSSKSAPLELELQEIAHQIEQLEINLESRLFSWSGLKEVFWQAVRFGGLGVAIGWSLAVLTIKNPPPQSTPPIPDTRISP